MSFLSKVTGRVQDVVPQKAEKLANRFLGDGGFMQMGATFHAPRTNTTEEIIASLKLLAKGEADKAENGRKNLLKMLDEAGLDFDKQAKNSAQDVAELTIQRQNAYVAALNDILRRGGTLTKAQREEYETLTR